MQNEAAQKRVTAHAKLFTVNDDRQVLCMLQRAADEDLAVIVQVWVAGEDHQLRAVIQVTSDERAQECFDGITDENIADVLEQVGINGVIRELDNG